METKDLWWGRKTYRWGWFFCALGWIILITSISAIPGRAIPHWDVLSYDKVIHFFIYLPLGWFVMGVFPPKTLARYGLMMIIIMFNGGLDEFHQHFVPGRFMSIWDWIFDAMGGAIGGVLYVWWEKRKIEARET